MPASDALLPKGPPPLTSEQLKEAMLGRQVEHYRITGLAGTGGMCIVFAATHVTLSRRVAIKFLSPELISRKEAWARFFNEARAASHVKHPGVVEIHHDGLLQPEGLPYIIMEFLEGDALWDRLHSKGGYHPSWIRFLRQIASAVAAIHTQEIVHRDLKPQNVMLIKDAEVPGGERIKLLDFGIAKLKERHLLPHDPLLRRVRPEDAETVYDSFINQSILGTPQYMSPEQCTGSWQVTDKSDVYSLGAMAYRMLSGCPVFDIQGIKELFYSHIHQEPAPLTGLVPWLPPPLAELVHQMLAKDPRKRPAMTQVAEQLERWENDPRIVPPLEPSSEHSPAPVSRIHVQPTVVTTPPRWPVWKIATAGGILLTLLAVAMFLGLR